MKKYLIYFFLFLFFNCIFINSLSANPTHVRDVSVSGEEAWPTGITFNTNGTKMFIVGTGDRDVTEYSLSDPYNASTKNELRNLSDNVEWPQDVEFNNDGTKMFIVSSSNDLVKSFTLSTGFDLSTASYDNNDYDTSNRGKGITFNTNGTKMFIVDNDEVFEYTLATGFDLSNVTFVQKKELTELSNDQSNGLNGIEFNTNGTRMFLVTQGGDIVIEYALSTGYSLTNISEVHRFTTVHSGRIQIHPKDVAIEGTKMFIIGNEGKNISQYTLPAAYNLRLPSLSSSSPSDDGTGVDLTANIVLNFDEPVDGDGGDIKIFKSSDTSNPVETIGATDSNVSGSGTTQITINPSSDFDQNTEYFVKIDSDAFLDSAGAGYYAGINSTTALSFTTENTLPTLVSSVPADDATDVAIDANIILNFSESVDVDNGNITIHKTSGGTTVETIDVTSSNVTGSGTTQITINPSTDFEHGVEYYVLIPSTAFVDGNSGYYAGITSTTALSFTVNNRVDPTTIKDVVGSIDAQSELAKNYISQSIDTVSNRLRYLRQNRLNNSLSSQDLQIDVGNTILTSLANDSIQKNTHSIMPDNWSAWSSGTISVVKIGDSTNSSLQETEGQGVALGFDKKLSDSDFIGFAIQYGQSDTDIGTNGTSIDSENMNFSIYRTKPLDDNNFIETFLGVGLIESDLKRVHNSNILTGSRDGTQIFGSINYGKTIDRGDFNLTPIGRLDLGLTELDRYTETGTDALSYAKQRIENGLASFGFEFSDNIKLNENKLRPFGSLTFITNFSNSSDAKMNYVADTSTIYTYTHKANSDHLLSSMIGLTYIAGDYLNINSSYSRVQGNRSEHRDTIDFAINFISNRETQYSLSLASDENAEAKLGISKNIYGFDLGFNANQSIGNNSNQEAELMLTYNY